MIIARICVAPIGKESYISNIVGRGEAMADVIIADLKRVKARPRKKAGSVREKRVRNSEGKLVRVLSLDANSTTFINDLVTVFEKNVARARLENVKLFGSADGLRTKNGSRAKK
jgi:hypothetical protein